MNQADFIHVLLHPDLPTPAEIIAPAHDSATRRFAIYRNNVIASLSDALEPAFPAIRALLGDTKFIGGWFDRIPDAMLIDQRRYGISR